LLGVKLAAERVREGAASWLFCVDRDVAGVVFVSQARLDTPAATQAACSEALLAALHLQETLDARARAPLLVVVSDGARYLFALAARRRVFQSGVFRVGSARELLDVAIVLCNLLLHKFPAPVQAALAEEARAK
jgi:hypothetical protein